MLVAAASSAAASPKKIGRALMTFYWIIDESSSRYRGSEEATLRDIRGKVIARTHPRFKKDLIMEGTGWLKDGRTVMYETRIHGENRFRITSARYGLGGSGCPLIPYRTVAVNSRFVKVGSTLYIPQLKGTKLPDGTIHDGIFLANDHGHFHGSHIDVFVGAGSKSSRPFARKGYGSRSHVTIYLVGEPDGHDCKP